MDEDYIYHYTSAAAILGIFRTRTIWASNYSYLNDGLEGKLIPSILEQIAGSRQSSSVEADSKLSNAFVEHLRWGHEFFLASFSRRPNMLTQFRMYCPSSGGYAIGFPRSYLTRAGKLLDVEYSTVNHTSWCQEYFVRFTEAAKHHYAPEKKPEEIAYDTICSGPWAYERAEMGIACKSDEFEAEEEVRLISTQVPVEPLIRPSENGSLFIPYVPIQLPNEEVTVRLVPGPSRYPELAQTGVQQLIHVVRSTGSRWTPAYLGISQSSFRNLS